MKISVVIPTCNRKERLLSLLENLKNSFYTIFEIIIIDSGSETLSSPELEAFKALNIIYIECEKSVCVQRNIGIAKAKGEWIFLCDDDIEVPVDYLQKLSAHIDCHSDAGAVSGLVLQKEDGEWKAKYPVKSSLSLIWSFIFQLSIWGEINCDTKNPFVTRVEEYYKKKGNFISKAGWPVITNFSGDYFTSPVYGLGASLVTKRWLSDSPYDEVLDSHGIGDNYGVAAGFPGEIHIVNCAFVYHHQEPANRLYKPIQYYRRALALDYFIRTKRSLKHIRRRWLVWSLIGNFLSFIFVNDRMMIKAAFKAIYTIGFGKNPYYKASKKKQKVIEPIL
jgi:glycosyltransferase involved in cell wall biosynthesis